MHGLLLLLFLFCCFSFLDHLDHIDHMGHLVEEPLWSFPSDFGHCQVILVGALCPGSEDPAQCEVLLNFHI